MESTIIINHEPIDKEDYPSDCEVANSNDVTKALEKAGFAKVDGESAIFGNMQGCERAFYKYKGNLYINGKKVSFCILSKADAKIFGAYCTGAIDADGAACETYTNHPQRFFSRLFGYLNGEITEADIIAEICF